MTLHRNLNQIGWGYNHLTWYVQKQLLAAGWIVAASGSGTGGLYSAAGDVFDRGGKNPVRGDDVTDIGVGIGQEHWGNTLCWVVMEYPTAATKKRQLLMYRDGAFGTVNDRAWRFYYSHAGDFTRTPTNVPSANVFPTCANGYLIRDSNMWDTDGSIIHVVANDVAINGEYGFWGLRVVSPNVFGGMIFFDPLQANEGALALHPLVVAGSESNLTSVSVLGSRGAAASANPKWVADAGLVSEEFHTAIYPYLDGFTTVYPGAAGVSPWDGKERPMIIPVHGRPLGPKGGYIGISSWFSWKAVGTRNYPDQADGEDYLYMGDLMLYGWDNTVIPTAVP